MLVTSFFFFHKTHQCYFFQEQSECKEHKGLNLQLGVSRSKTDEREVAIRFEGICQSVISKRQAADFRLREKRAGLALGQGRATDQNGGLTND